MKAITLPPVGFKHSIPALMAAVDAFGPGAVDENVSGIIFSRLSIASLFLAKETTRPLFSGAYESSTSGTMSIDGFSAPSLR